VQNPGVASIEIPLPSEAERLDFIRVQLAAKPLPAGSDVTPESLAALTAGLKRVQLQAMISDSVENQRPLTDKFLVKRKKDMIEAEAGGLLEFVQSRFDLSGWSPATSPPRSASRTPPWPSAPAAPTWCPWAT
jgi:SpoVK/Ycf46/Vps4 family AAA+-type ATPase